MFLYSRGFKMGKLKRFSEDHSLTFSLFCRLLVLVCLPALGVVWLYHKAVMLILWYIKRDNLYVGLMDGPDAMFEGFLSSNVAQLWRFVDFKAIEKNGLEPLATMKALMKQVVEERNSKYWKLACLRKCSIFGYYFWERQRSFNMDEHVKWMPIEAEDMTEEALRGLVNSMSSLHLPKEHQATWELLVGKGPVLGSSWGTPLLFRIHHSVADGPGLVKFIEESLAVTKLSQHPILTDHSLSTIPENQKSGLSFKHQLIMMTRLAVDHVISLLSVAECFIRQYLWISHYKLHDPWLSGVHNVAFLNEDPPQPGATSLMEKIRRIRERFGCRFTDVLLAALAEVLGAHLKGRPSLPPTGELAVALLSRPTDQGLREMRTNVKSSTKTWDHFVKGPWSVLAWVAGMIQFLPEGRLSNDFTYGFVRIPLIAEGGLLGKLGKVLQETARLRASGDFKTGLVLWKNLFHFIPALLRKQTTLPYFLCLSNFPGQKSYGTIAGHPVKQSMNIPVSYERYGIALVSSSFVGQLNFGIIVDTAIIPDRDEVEAILEEIGSSIQKLYELCT